MVQGGSEALVRVRREPIGAVNHPGHEDRASSKVVFKDEIAELLFSRPY